MPDDERKLDASPFSSAIPRRFWWLKRLAIAYVALALGVVGLRYQWLSLAQAKVSAEVNQYHAQGQPILPEDFRKTPPLVDEKNAAIVLRAVSSGMTRDEAESFSSLRINSAQADLDKARELLNGRKKVFAEIRRARALGAADWETEMKSPLLGVNLPHLNAVRELTELSRVAALVESNAGNHREAIEHCRDIAFLARSIQDEPFLVSHLVSTSIDSTGAMTALSIGRNLRANDAQTREAVVALINELLEDQGLRKSAAYALYGERAAQLDVVRHMAAGNSGREIGFPVHDSAVQTFVYWWLRPIFEEDGGRMLRFTSSHVAAVQAPDSVASRQMMPKDPPETRGAVILQPLSRMIMPSFRNVFGRHYMVQKERNRAAIELASVLYFADHGKQPLRIEDLVPRYLPRVPADPLNGGTMSIATTQPAK